MSEHASPGPEAPANEPASVVALETGSGFEAALPRGPVHALALGPTEVIALQRTAGNALVSRYLAGEGASTWVRGTLARAEAQVTGPASPPAHQLAEAVPRIVAFTGDKVTLSVDGKDVTVDVRTFARDWAPGGANPAVRGSNYWYRTCWERICSGSGIPVGVTGARPDEGVSVELADAPAGETSALRVIAWLDKHKDLIAAAEAKFKVNRLAIAGAIAWEALENVRGSVAGAVGRFEGPGKVHIKEDRGLPAAITTGTTSAEEVEQAGLLPATTVSERAKLLKTPAGSIEYIAGIMRLGADIASEYGFDISGDPLALSFYFNAMDSAKWRAKLEDKRPGSDFVFLIDITEWISHNLPFLEKAVGKPAGGPAAKPEPESEPDPEDLRKRIERMTFTLADMLVRADAGGAPSIIIEVKRSGGELTPSLVSEDGTRATNRSGMSMASALSQLKAPMGLLMRSQSVRIAFVRGSGGWLEMSVSTTSASPQAKPAPLARATADAPAAQTVAEPTITYGKQADPDAMTPEALALLKDILKAAGITSAQISSTARDADDQARAMYNNLEGTGDGKGVAAQRKLYSATGDKVIDVYEELKKEKKSADEIKKAMAAKITELGPSTVSLHIADRSKLCVFDVGPKSIDEKLHAKLTEAAKAELGKRLHNFIPYPADPGFHFEVKVASAKE